MKPIILITAGIENTNRNLLQTFCYKTYSEAVSNAGGIPLIVGDENNVEELADLADGLYLTGGEDVDATTYGGDPDICHDIDLWRDPVEFNLVKAFMERKKPIFGICRGIQVINIVLGGTLIEDIKVRTGYEHPAGSKCSHMVTMEPGSFLHELYGDAMEVNSFHHQVVDKLGEGLKAVAWTKEGMIEAVEHESLPITAVQWHPERMTGEHPYTPVGPDMDKLFEFYCKQCIDRKE